MKQSIWDLSKIQQIPECFEAYGFEEEGVLPVFYENMPWKGKKTRAFAWYGFPEGASAEHPVPGVVLVHGGGGTALADWCRDWLKRGFAVIAMDNCGGVPSWNTSPHHRMKWPRHEFSGPAGWGNIDQSKESPEDQWVYHAVSSVLRAKELLASFPQVRKERIGINGISWGAVLACIAIGLDQSFRFAIPVYGCGGFNTPESFLCNEKDDPECRKLWFELWDPNHYLAETSVPSLFLTGTNDNAFPLENWIQSTRLPKGKVYRSLRPDYCHDHSISWKSKTLIDFAAAFSENGTLPEIGTVTRNGRILSAGFEPGDRKIISAELFFTRAEGAWMDRKWNRIPAILEENTVFGELPILTKACFLGIHDEKGCFWTSDLVML